MSSEKDLDMLFEQARSAPPEPSHDFLARVLSDAEAMQPAPAGVMSAPVVKRSAIGAFFAGLGDAIGGWPAVAGLATAAVTGVYIGISPPQSLSAPLAAAFGETSLFSETLEYGDGFDFTLYEG